MEKNRAPKVVSCGACNFADMKSGEHRTGKRSIAATQFSAPVGRRNHGYFVVFSLHRLRMVWLVLKSAARLFPTFVIVRDSQRTFQET